jgi:cytochrome P450
VAASGRNHGASRKRGGERNGIGNAVWLFAQHPDQWDLIREDPSRFEVVEMERSLNNILRGFSHLRVKVS